MLLGAVGLCLCKGQIFTFSKAEGMVQEYFYYRKVSINRFFQQCLKAPIKITKVSPHHYASIVMHHHECKSISASKDPGPSTNANAVKIADTIWSLKTFVTILVVLCHWPSTSTIVNQ